MPDSAQKAIEDKVRGVESEQGSATETGSDPPPNFGHGSAASAGTSGNMMPGTKK
jgi:hypothetical protein